MAPDAIETLGPRPDYIPDARLPANRVRPRRQEIARVAPADRGEVLETLVDKSLAKMNEILDIPLIPGDDDFTKVLSSQKDAAMSVLNTSLKADENRFRKQAADGLTRLLDAIERKEKSMRGELAAAGPLLEQAAGH